MADGHVGGWVPWGEPRAQNLMSFAEHAATLVRGLLIIVCNLSAKTSAHSLPPDAPPLPPDPLAHWGCHTGQLPLVCFARIGPGKLDMCTQLGGWEAGRGLRFARAAEGPPQGQE